MANPSADVDIKDRLKDYLRRLHPSRTQDAFRRISNELDDIITSGIEELSRAEEKIIEDRNADECSFPPGTSARDYISALNSMLSSILESDDYRDGIYCLTTAPQWAQIQTSYVLHVFRYLNLPYASWFAKDQRRSTEAMVQALLREQRTDGSWGEDFYDTCFTLGALFHYAPRFPSLACYAPATSRAMDYVFSQIDTNFEAHRDQEWYGAGFYGAALGLLGRHSDSIVTDCEGVAIARIESAIMQLFENARQYFRESEDNEHAWFQSSGVASPTTPDEWHTAEMLIGMHYTSEARKQDADAVVVDKCVRWLEHRRGGRPLWCNAMGSRMSFVITGRVLHSLALTTPQEARNAVARLTPIIVRHQAGSGLVYDLPVTINLLLGISAQQSVAKHTTHNPLQTGVLSARLQNILKRVGAVKHLADDHAKSRKEDIIKFGQLLALIFVLFALPLIYTLLKAFQSP